MYICTDIHKYVVSGGGRGWGGHICPPGLNMVKRFDNHYEGDITESMGELR